jgi:hypothetical protein
LRVVIIQLFAGSKDNVAIVDKLFPCKINLQKV